MSDVSNNGHTPLDAAPVQVLPAPELPPDSWRWRVHYVDGSLLEEYDGERQRPWADAQQLGRIRAIELVPQQPGLINHAVFVQDGEEARFFRRRSIEIDQNTGQQWHRPSITALALSSGGSTTYAFFHPDGGVIFSSDVNQPQ